MSSRSFVFTLPALVAAALAASAQSPAPVPAVNDAADPSAEEVITLDAFTVTSPSGYIVEDSSTGARLAVKLVEHPFTINTVTSDFIRDFAGVELREWFSYTPGFAVQEGEGNYSVRGQRATSQLRNGFFRGGLIDASNIERAEVIKGPAAAIYGRTAPGGLVNILTKKAPATYQASAGYQLGGYGFRRAQLSAGGPVVPGTLFFRLDGALQEQDETHDFYTIENEALSGSLLWKISRDTSVTVELEYVSREDSTDSEMRAPFIWTANPAGNGPGTQTSRIDPSKQTYNHQSNRQGVTGLTRESLTSYFNLEHRFNEVLSFRLGGFVSDRPATRRAYDGDRWVPALNTFYNREPLFRFFNERSDGFQADLAATFATGAVKHRVLLTGDYFYNTNSDQIWRLPTALLNNPAYNRRTLNVANPDFFFPTLDRSVYTLRGRDNGSTVKYSGGFISDRLTLLDERLNVMAGLRYTHIDTLLYNNNATNTAANPFARRSRIAVTAYDPQLGATCRVWQPVTVFASYAESTREQTAVALNNAGTLLTDPEQGQGVEFGLKLVGPGNCFNATVSYFDQLRKNVVRTDPVTQENVLTGEENSRGFELSGALNLTANWQVLASAAVMEARITEPSRALLLLLQQGAALGLTDLDRITQSPERQYSLATRYQFKTGALKGLSLNGGVKYYGDQLTGNGSLVALQYLQPSYTLVDLGASYTLRLPEDGKFRHSFRVNVKNALDDEWYFGDRKLGRGRQFIFGYELSFR